MQDPGPSSPGTEAAGDDLLRRLIELHPGFLWATDRDLRLLVVEGSGLVARGAESPEEFVGRTLHELLEPGDIALEMHARALAGESVAYTSLRAESTWQAHIEPLRGRDGEVEGTAGIAIDVTDLVQAEHELDLNRAQLDLSLAQLPAIIWAVDTDLKLTSAAGRPIQDRSIGSWIGHRLPDLFGDASHPSVAAHEAALAGGTGAYEITIEEHEYQARVSPMRNRDGDIIGAVGLAVDVTVERREHLAAEQLALLVNHSTDAIAGVGRNGKVFSWNPAAERLFGWSAEEMIGESTDRIVPPEEHEEWSAARARALAGEIVEELEATRVRKDGTLIRVWLTRSPIFDEQGEVAGFCVIARDLAVRDRDGERQETGQKLEAVARLAGGIAQDFNNLLTAIAGYSDLVAPELPAESPGREALESIRAATERAVTLTQGLLAFGQRRVLHPRVVDLNAFVTEARPLLERLVTRGVTLELTLARDVRPVLFDPDALRQILFDLVLNASDAMPDGGTIQLETRAAPDAALLRVGDAGIGMDAETRERAFDPFFSTKDAISGTGLGLASVHGTVLQSGGEVRLESSPGGGTWVELGLPVAAEHPASASEPRATGGRVLLVEDDELVRRLVVQTLENGGYVVTTPASPAEALQLVRDGAEFDLVLTDLVMPELYGDELLAQLRALRPGLPAIVMSGYVHERGSFPDDVEFLSKPFRPTELVATVARTLGS
jgi:two-component system, cell cycle sensor histidine kinase and response regulator CckA